ncbi:MAG TPA: ATP-binding protein [Solirubrobacterales bacterium]|nr:ATP-binding protein [Solirubrobacterales bacterium]
MHDLFPRGDRSLVLAALGDTRAVFILGARQVGKSTLAHQIAEYDHPAQIVNLDEKAAREAAVADPEGFIAALDRPVLIDEVQRGSADLLLAIKATIDEDLSPGQFLLTGSANVLRNQKVSDALTGRVEMVQLWPLAQAEIEGSTNNFVDALFAVSPPRVEEAPKGRAALADRIVAGGYPEARLRAGNRQARWFQSYLQTTFEKDLETISDAHKLHEMPRLLRLLASQAANLFVPANLSRRLDLDHRTVASYVGMLETIFLVKRIPAWRPGLGQREIQTPKIYVVDSGLLLYLLGADEERLMNDDQVTGKALENFVAMEIVKHAEWSEIAPQAYHYRRGPDEVDLVLENRAGEIAAVEVKGKVSLQRKDWRALEKLRDKRGSDFKCGVVVHTGSQTIPLGDRLFAVPLSGLWA